VFAALLALGAVLLAFLPVLHHAWTFVASRRTIALLVALILIVGVGAVVLVTSAASNPVYLVPIAGITVALRIVSPFLLHRRIQDRFEASRSWDWLRWLAAGGFLGFAVILAYHLLLLAAGGGASQVAILSEQVAMALGASLLIVRAGLRVRPRETTEAWPIWGSAVLLALAFVVVLPYVVPAFEVVYAVSGLIGWSIGIAAAVRDL